MQWPKAAELPHLLSAWIEQQRWFPGSALPPETTTLFYQELHYPHVDEVRHCFLDTGREILNVPLVLTAKRPRRGLITEVPGGFLQDASVSAVFWRAWLESARRQGSIGCLRGQSKMSIYFELFNACDEIKTMDAQQSNSSVILKAPLYSAVMKIFRIIHPGVNPEVEVGAALTNANWQRLAQPLAWQHVTVDLGGKPQEFYTGIATRLIFRAQDGFQMFQGRAQRGQDTYEIAQELGAVTKQMHQKLRRALGRGPRVSGSELASKLRQELQLTAGQVKELNGKQFLSDFTALTDKIAKLSDLPQASRVHGDYHLGQTLYVPGDGWFVIDFEGEVTASPQQRRQMHCPLKDVAGMLRSFDYASKSAAKNRRAKWLRRVREGFLTGYFGPQIPADLELALKGFEALKALYEVRYENSYRPDWVSIPLEGLQSLLEQA